MIIKETHYDVNGFRFIKHDDGNTSIISRTGHDKLEFKKSKKEILKQFKDALEEYLEGGFFDHRNDNDLCFAKYTFTVHEENGIRYLDSEFPPLNSNADIDIIIRELHSLRK